MKERNILNALLIASLGLASSGSRPDLSSQKIHEKMIGDAKDRISQPAQASLEELTKVDIQETAEGGILGRIEVFQGKDSGVSFVWMTDAEGNVLSQPIVLSNSEVKIIDGSLLDISGNIAGQVFAPTEADKNWVAVTNLDWGIARGLFINSNSHTVNKSDVTRRLDEELKSTDKVTLAYYFELPKQGDNSFQVKVGIYDPEGHTIGIVNDRAEQFRGEGSYKNAMPLAISNPEGKLVFAVVPGELPDGTVIDTTKVTQTIGADGKPRMTYDSGKYTLDTKTFQWELTAAIPGTEIISHYTETIRAEDTKYNIPVMIITDEKMVHANPMMTIDKIYANDDPDFRTRYGETAKEAIAHAVAYAEYQCWQKNDPDNVARRTGVSFNTYWKMVQEAQNGERDWSEVEFQTWANDLTTPEYDAIKRTFRPGNPVSIAHVNSYKNTMINFFKGSRYLGTEMDSEGNLSIYIGGYPIMASLQGTIVNSTVTANLSMALDRLSWKTQGNMLPQKEFYEHAAPIGRYNSDIFGILSVQSTPPDDWVKRFKDWPWVPGYYDTALAISPNNEVSQP